MKATGHSLIVGAEEVDEGCLVQEDGALLLTLHSKAKVLLRRLDLLFRLVTGRLVDVEIREMADVGDVLAVLIFRHGNLAIGSQDENLLAPSAHLLRMVQSEFDLRRLSCRCSFQAQLAFDAFGRLVHDEKRVRGVRVP